MPGTSAASGSTTSSTSSMTCTYPPVNNPPGCPARYGFAYYGEPCPMAGLTCSYPGEGDGMPDGCFYTAGLSCISKSLDGGAPVWVTAQ
jgi:hypothetical protein